MLRAARGFDGVVLSGGLGPDAVRWSRAHLGDAGPTPRPEVVAIVLLARPAGERPPVDVLRDFVVAALGAPHHRAVAAATAPDLAPALAALAAGDRASARQAVSDTIARGHGLVSDEDTEPGLAPWRAAGVDLPVLWPLGDHDGWRWLAKFTET